MGQARTKTFSIRVWNVIFLLMTGVTISASYVAAGYTSPPLRLPILMLCWFLLFYFTHSPAHYFAGRLFGIRFEYYFLGTSRISRAGIPLLSRIAKKLPYVVGVRIDRSSLNSVSRKGVAIMYLSGPLASVFAPSLVPLISQAVGVSTVESAILVFLTLGNATVSLYLSKKHGCIAKAVKLLKMGQAALNG